MVLSMLSMKVCLFIYSLYANERVLPSTKQKSLPATDRPNPQICHSCLEHSKPVTFPAPSLAVGVNLPTELDLQTISAFT